VKETTANTFDLATAGNWEKSRRKRENSRVRGIETHPRELLRKKAFPPRPQFGNRN